MSADLYVGAAVAQITSDVPAAALNLSTSALWAETTVVETGVHYASVIRPGILGEFSSITAGGDP